MMRGMQGTGIRDSGFGIGRRLPRQSRITAVALAIVAGLASAACGYSLAGRGSFLPAYIQTIGVPLFANNTPYFEVEQILTERVRAEFIGRGKYQVKPERTGVDAILRGEITSIAIVPATFNQQQQASRYVILVTAKVEFFDVKADKVVWKNPELTFRQEYDIASGTGALDPNAFFGQQSNALERVASEFAKTVVSSLLEAF